MTEPRKLEDHGRWEDMTLGVAGGVHRRWCLPGQGAGCRAKTERTVTFLDDYHAGRASAEDIDSYIDQWHADGKVNPWGPKLWRYLGMTWREYQRWLALGELPPVKEPVHD